MVTKKEPELRDDLEAAKKQAEELNQQNETLTRQLESKNSASLVSRDSALWVMF